MKFSYFVLLLGMCCAFAAQAVESYLFWMMDTYDSMRTVQPGAANGSMRQGICFCSADTEHKVGNSGLSLLDMQAKVSAEYAGIGLSYVLELIHDDGPDPSGWEVAYGWRSL